MGGSLYRNSLIVIVNIPRGRGFFLPPLGKKKRVGTSWLETDSKRVRKKGRRERMTGGTRSLRSVLSELLSVTDPRSCGGGSSITDSRIDYVFPFSIIRFRSRTEFRRISHTLFSCIVSFDRALSCFYSSPSSCLVDIGATFHVRSVTRGWKNWTNHGKWKRASSESVCYRVHLGTGTEKKEKESLIELVNWYRWYQCCITWQFFKTGLFCYFVKKN